MRNGRNCDRSGTPEVVSNKISGMNQTISYMNN